MIYGTNRRFLSSIIPRKSGFGDKLGAKTISHDTWIHRIVERGVTPLVDTPVTPNHLTTVRLAAGLAAAACYAVGEAPWHYIASALFVFSLLMDRADGILARLSGKTSPWGHTYDLIADGICNAAVFIGIGVGLRDSVLGLWSIPLGIVAGIAVTLVFFMVLRVEDIAGARAAELEGRAGFDPDDAILLVPLAMILGWGVPLVVVSAIGAGAFAVFFYLRFRTVIKRRPWE